MLCNVYRVKDRSFSENLTSILDIQLPKHPDVLKDDKQTECGVCYAQYLPIGIDSFLSGDFKPLKNLYAVIDY